MNDPIPAPILLKRFLDIGRQIESQSQRPNAFANETANPRQQPMELRPHLRFIGNKRPLLNS